MNDDQLLGIIVGSSITTIVWGIVVIFAGCRYKRTIRNLRWAIQYVGGYLMSTQRVNTTDWLEGVQDRIDCADMVMDRTKGYGSEPPR